MPLDAAELLAFEATSRLSLELMKRFLAWFAENFGSEDKSLTEKLPAGYRMEDQLQERFIMFRGEPAFGGLDADEKLMLMKEPDRLATVLLEKVLRGVELRHSFAAAEQVFREELPKRFAEFLAKVTE